MYYLFRLRGCDMLGITEGEREEIFSIVSVLVIVRRGASKQRRKGSQQILGPVLFSLAWECGVVRAPL